MDEGTARDFADLAVRLHGEEDLGQTVDKVLEFALRAVTCDHAGLMIVHAGQRVETIGVTDPVAERADAFQYECQEGPCLSAIFDATAFRIDDTGVDERWPVWGPKVAGIGLHSVLSIRLRTISEKVGALNLYGREPDAFDTADEEVAQVLARHASIALASVRQEFQLWQEIDARQLVGLAQGILMERYDLTEDQAFGVLRRYSQGHNLKLREVAQRLVDTRRLPGATT